MGNLREPLAPDFFCHIFNHSVGTENLFRSEGNYNFFLKQFSKYILPASQIYAYCLMPNHFHFALRIKEEKELAEIWKDKIQKKEIKFKTGGTGDRGIFEELINEQFSHFFNSYVQAYNKSYNRMGALLKQSFQRKRVEGDNHLRQIICYIHNNPVQDNFAEKPRDWKFSSFNSFLSNKPTLLKRKEVLELFEGKENFLYIHENYRTTSVIP